MFAIDFLPVTQPSPLFAGGINLSENSLTGGIPSEIGLLGSMRKLTKSPLLFVGSSTPHEICT